MKLTVTFGDNVLFERDVESCTTEETASGTFTASAAFSPLAHATLPGTQLDALLDGLLTEQAMDVNRK